MQKISRPTIAARFTKPFSMRGPYSAGPVRQVSRLLRFAAGAKPVCFSTVAGYCIVARAVPRWYRAARTEACGH